MRSCIVNGYIISPENNLNGVMDLWIENGRILQIVKKNEKGSWCCGAGATQEAAKRWAEVYIDAAGKWVVPGLIDLHVHFRQPGQTHKEDMASGAASAAKGGFTAVCCMPNTTPPIDDADSLSAVDAAGKEAAGAHALITSSITKGQMGKELVDFNSLMSLDTRAKQLLGRGVAAITEDGRSVESEEVMENAMAAAKEMGIPVFDHAEPELAIVEREIRLSEKTGCPVHFCHISKKECVDAIRKAKREGVQITAETAPHYLPFTDKEVGENPNRKMNPPIGTEEDRQALIKGIADGTIDVIATDHAPHHPSEKDTDFEKAPNGVIGLETSFGVCYTYLVKSGLISPERLLEIMSVNPAKILGLDRGIIAEGKTADLTVIDVTEEWTVPETGFASKAVNTPFAGLKLLGLIERTMISGHTVYKCE